MRWSFSGFDIMSVAWWILKEIPTHSTNTALFSAVLLVEKFTRTLEIILQPGKTLYIACVSEKFAKTKKFLGVLLFWCCFCLFRCHACNYEFWHFENLHLWTDCLCVVCYVLLISDCCCASQRSHFGSGSAEAAWRSFPAVEWVMSSGNSIHTLSLGAAALCLLGKL